MLKFGMHTHLPLYTLFLTLRISDLEEFFFYWWIKLVWKSQTCNNLTSQAKITVRKPYSASPNSSVFIFDVSRLFVPTIKRIADDGEGPLHY